MAEYYDETFKLHWDPKIYRKGLGTLLKKVNHIAIIVSDVNKSLTFYTEVIGLQQIRRPNFDRHGAWLTMGNVELHLIKGNPVVHQGDNLIVPHISVESEDIEAVLRKLMELKVPFSKNVSVPDAAESKPITQYFIRDPDGYYIELCNCDILTDFCLGKDNVGIHYNEVVENAEFSHIFKLAFLAQKLLEVNVEEDLVTLIPPKKEWAAKADPIKLNNMLSRCKIYGDLMQNETSETIALALRQANNKVPLATKIIRALKLGKEVFLPPAFYVQGDEKYQPSPYSAPRKASVTQWRKVSTVTPNEVTNDQMNAVNGCGNINEANDLTNGHKTEDGKTVVSVNCEKEYKSGVDSYMAIAKKTFNHFDTNKDGVLSKEETKNVLRVLRQDANHPAFAKLFSKTDLNDDGVIDFEEFVQLIKDQPPIDDIEHWRAFFNLLDIDGNGKITCPEMAMVIRELNFAVHDSHIEKLFIEADEDGNGYLTIDELRNFFLN